MDFGFIALRLLIERGVFGRNQTSNKMKNIIELVQIGFNTMLNINRPYCSAGAFLLRVQAIKIEESKRLEFMGSYAEQNQDVTYFSE